MSLYWLILALMFEVVSSFFLWTWLFLVSDWSCIYVALWNMILDVFIIILPNYVRTAVLILVIVELSNSEKLHRFLGETRLICSFEVYDCVLYSSFGAWKGCGDNWKVARGKSRDCMLKAQSLEQTRLIWSFEVYGCVLYSRLVHKNVAVIIGKRPEENEGIAC